ncbi:MAG TPA: glycosyltransferase family 39 protein [Tepidisphaeraceae bacterium]
MKAADLETPVIQRNVPPLLSRAAILTAAILVICIGARSVASWKYWGDLDHNSPGTWLCMAADARDGVLYRPIISELGYGGTRYAPLFPLIIAAFMRLGIDPVVSGFIAGLIAAAIAITGLFALMKRLGTPTAIAAALAISVLAATCTRTIILGIKGDLLPAGLALWGLVFVVWSDEKRHSTLGLIVAGICFALALAVKVTSIFGIAAATIWLLFRRKYHEAAILALTWVLGVAVAVLVTQWASDGRAKAIFLICAGGGGNIGRMLQGPNLLLHDVAHQDRTLLAFWIISIFIIAATRQWTSLSAILLLVVTAGTILIYGSPGTHLNHLVDMNIAAILVIGTLSAKSRALHSPVLAVTLLFVILAAVACLRQIGEIRRHDERGQINSALADTRTSIKDGPILSQDPLLPLIDGERPYMLDPFIFRAIRSRKPEIADQFWQDLDGRHFKAVVLHAPPSDPAFSSNEGDFGPGFIDRLQRSYAPSSVHGSFYIFMPKK